MLSFICCFFLTYSMGRNRNMMLSEGLDCYMWSCLLSEPAVRQCFPEWFNVLLSRSCHMYLNHQLLKMAGKGLWVFLENVGIGYCLRLGSGLFVKVFYHLFHSGLSETTEICCGVFWLWWWYNELDSFICFLEVHRISTLCCIGLCICVLVNEENHLSTWRPFVPIQCIITKFCVIWTIQFHGLAHLPRYCSLQLNDLLGQDGTCR